jgi:hypothetical protein
VTLDPQQPDQAIEADQQLIRFGDDPDPPSAS